MRAAVAIAALIGVVLPGPGSAHGGAERGPLISGTTSQVEGAFVWTDYAYDDHGANLDGSPGGDVAYPEGLENAADLIQLQLELGPQGLRILGILETLLDASRPLLALGLDTDANPATGAPQLPGGGWTAQGALGIDDLVVLAHGTAELRHHDGAAWSTVATFPASVDPSSNVMETTVPPGLLPPSTGVWNAVAALGLRDAGSSWLDGASPIHDLAFVGDELPRSWQSVRQGDVLSGLLASAEAVAAVDPGRLASGDTELARATEPGFHTFLYRADLDLGEGIVLVNDLVVIGYLYAGPYQPYLVWLPEALPDPPPLVTLMHGAGGTHLSSAELFTDPLPATEGPAFDLPAVVAFPLGRGELNYYFGASERDVLDAMADAQARFATDPDRNVLSGISMGGLGTWRLGQLHPHRFSALVPLINPSRLIEPVSGRLDTHFLPRQLETLWNVPLRVIHGRLDPLAGGPSGDGPDQDAAEMTALRNEFRYYSILGRQHEVVPSSGIPRA